MIAMQYTIRLAGDYDLQQVRERAVRRKPVFDKTEGLVHKSYLFNESQLVYAPFYVWQNDDAARNYLTGDLFRDLAETFGRPRVRLWNVLACESNISDEKWPKVGVKELDVIPAEQDLADLMRVETDRHRKALAKRGLCFHVTGLDPDRWELMRYSAWCDPGQIRDCDSDVAETFDILQICPGCCAT